MEREKERERKRERRRSSEGGWSGKKITARKAAQESTDHKAREVVEWGKKVFKYDTSYYRSTIILIIITRVIISIINNQ